MPATSPKHHRHSARLKDYDYTQAGAYFVTICTHERDSLFGEIVKGQMLVNETGKIVAEIWDTLPLHHPTVELDAFVVMPNHVHGIIVVSSGDGNAAVGAQRAAPLPVQPNVSTPSRLENPINVTPGSLGAIVRAFKSAVTKRVHELQPDSGLPVWQRNYYDHIIRNEKELTLIRRYIENNPLQWALDRDNLSNPQPPAASIMSYLLEALKQPLR